MKSLGFKVTPLSPSREARSELAASFFWSTASFLGKSVSSTQAIVATVVGVGLVNGHEYLPCMFLRRVCLGLVVVFFSAMNPFAGLFAFVSFTPTFM